jgi:hypothetical protein
MLHKEIKEKKIAAAQ